MTMEAVKATHEKALREETEKRAACSPRCQSQEKAIRCLQGNKPDVPTHHEIATVSKVDDAHKPEHQAQAGCQEEEEHAEGNTVQYLSNGNG